MLIWAIKNVRCIICFLLAIPRAVSDIRLQLRVCQLSVNRSWGTVSFRFYKNNNGVAPLGGADWLTATSFYLVFEDDHFGLDILTFTGYQIPVRAKRPKQRDPSIGREWDRGLDVLVFAPMAVFIGWRAVCPRSRLRDRRTVALRPDARNQRTTSASAGRRVTGFFPFATGLGQAGKVANSYWQYMATLLALNSQSTRRTGCSQCMITHMRAFRRIPERGTLC